MKLHIKCFNGVERDPEEMWEPDGCMAKAIEGSQRKKVTQRVFDNLELPDDVAKYLNRLRMERQKRNAKSVIENSTCDEATDAPVTAHYSSYQKHAGESAPSTSHTTMGHCSSGSHNTDDDIPPSIIYVASDATSHDIPTEPMSSTISRLKGDKCLESVDILRCTKVFQDIPRGWHIFDPGYPLKESGPRGQPLSAIDLIFFLNQSHHWSLCHLNTITGHLHHYNSLSGIDMSVNRLRSWVSKEPTIRTTTEITIWEKECPQQGDGFNCGIFALAVAQCLVEKKSIPSQVNTKELRSYFAERIESTQQLTSPDLDSSLSPIRPVIRSTSLPANSRSSQSISIESQGFFENLRREEGRLEIGRPVIAKKEVQLLSMKQGLGSRRQKLKEREDMASVLRGQVSDPETTEAVLVKIEVWINECPEGVGIMKERINEMKSDAASRKKSMREESKFLRERLRTVEAECDDIRKEVKQLEDQIPSHEKELKAMMETEQHLAHIKQSCAEFAKSR
ncbi:hypothetical protein F53441_1850 [Fusarium austroafricanum]|uniref:Ubiquitin-like protease family profile domain-containing protein n=1 Tax=Fusarium austroafricanum TaxID=2364996 RepID=A0A8H4P3J5_9HYPO|nr:hypothetical protein F53441_1850 [Fusarium austroafricanum]